MNPLRVQLRDTVLICPWCGGNNLHHGTVTIYSRTEDAEVTTITRVGGTEPTSPQGNPSARRDGLSIDFWCETCECLPELTIAQHKGETLVQWRYLGGLNEP